MLGQILYNFQKLSIRNSYLFNKAVQFFRSMVSARPESIHKAYDRYIDAEPDHHRVGVKGRKLFRLAEKASRREGPQEPNKVKGLDSSPG